MASSSIYNRLKLPARTNVRTLSSDIARYRAVKRTSGSIENRETSGLLTNYSLADLIDRLRRLRKSTSRDIEGSGVIRSPAAGFMILLNLWI